MHYCISPGYFRFCFIIKKSLLINGRCCKPPTTKRVSNTRPNKCQQVRYLTILPAQLCLQGSLGWAIGNCITVSPKRKVCSLCFAFHVYVCVFKRQTQNKKQTTIFCRPQNTNHVFAFVFLE